MGSGISQRPPRPATRRRDRVADLRRVLPTALRDVVLAAAAAEGTGRDAHEVTGADAALSRAASFVATTTTGRPLAAPVIATTLGRSAPRRPRRSSTIDVVRSGLPGVVAEERDAVDVARLLGEGAALPSDLDAAGPLELALGVLEPGHRGADPLGELVRAGPTMLLGSATIARSRAR